MTFDDIIAQDHVKQYLLGLLRQERVPHALMLCGPEGCGAFGLALSFAQSMLGGGGMAEKLQHPDLHFAFPIFKKQSGKDSFCDDFLPQWRAMALSHPYFGMAEWMNEAGAENQQLHIYRSEGHAITRKFSIKSSQGGYKVLIVWLPEKMQDECANHILKLIEEPPAQSLFLFVSERPEQVLSTVRSRTQMIEVPPIPSEEMERALVQRHNIEPGQARVIARASHGNMAQALRTITSAADDEAHFDLFVQLMRYAYARQVKELRLWSEQVAGMGRERIKDFLAYCQRMTRENFVYNFGRQDRLNYMTRNETGFAVRFAPFVNERNVIGIMNELTLAQRDVAQNVNPKIVFFDFALKMIALIRNAPSYKPTT